jgi:proteasome lid subunit RPN8/RPN11
VNAEMTVIGRMERFTQDCRALEDLAQRCDRITFRPLVEREVPRGFVVGLHLRAVTSVDRNDAPRYGNRFVLMVRLPAGYPDQAPECSLSSEGNPAFHPHFVPMRANRFTQSGGEWVDYQRYDPREGVAGLVLRIARSLRYEAAYVRPDARSVNQAARTWYLRWIRSNHAAELFPTDQSPLPAEALRPGSLAVQTADARKTFIVQPPLAAPALPRTDPPAAPGPPVAEAAAPKRFDVQEVTPRFAPSPRPRPTLRHREDLRSDLRTHGPHGHEVYVRLAAMEHVQHHIAWGRMTHANRNEQCGLLLGRLFTDPASELSYAMVDFAVPGETAQGTAVHVDVDHHTWKAMLDRADRIMEGRPGLEIMGWYHTHPNHLDVFMSEADLRSQARAFGTPWQCAMVLNPHRRCWRVFIGPEGHECPGYVIVDEETTREHHALAPGTDTGSVADRGPALRQPPPMEARGWGPGGYPATRRSDGPDQLNDEPEDIAGLVSRFIAWVRSGRGNRGSFM